MGTFILFQHLLSSESGFLLPSLFADVLALIIFFYVLVAVLFPGINYLKEFKTMTEDIGGPKPHWLLGNVLEYGYDQKGLLNSMKRCEEHPAMCTHYLTVLPTIHVYHPDVVKTALSRGGRKSWHYDKFVKPTLREGLITSNGSYWKRHRRLLTTIFHFDILKQHCFVFNEISGDMLNTLETIANSGKSGDVAEAIGLSSFESIMKCVMSQSILDKNGASFVKDVHDINDLLLDRQQSLVSLFEFIYWKSPKGRKLARVQQNIFKEAQRIIDQRREILKLAVGNENEETSLVEDPATGKSFTFRKRKGKPVDFLDVLIQTEDQNGIRLTDTEITDEVLTFFLAGQETVATGSVRAGFVIKGADAHLLEGSHILLLLCLSWAFYLLATHPNIQAKCREEVLREIGDKEICELSDLSKLSFLTQCIKETLRMYPPVHAISRDLTEDTVFSYQVNGNKEFVLKKGTTVVINIFALHRNCHVWKNPEMFDPERFSTENIKSIQPYAFVPFAAGPRNCIGQNFAMVEMKVMLTQVLRKYELCWDSSLPPLDMDVGITNRPAGGVPLIIKKLKE